MVVVASLGRRAPERWLMGSVSERIAERSPVPTLVVRQSEAMVAWAREGRPLRVVCGYDFTTTADAALRYVRELRRIGPVELTVVQVNWPFEDERRLGLSASVLVGTNPPEMQAVLERGLRERVAELLGKEKVSIRIEPGLGRPDFSLVALARAERADLVIVGAHQWRGVDRFWNVSTSRGILHHAPMSVLVVPAAGEPEESTIPEIRRVLVTTDFSSLGNEAIPHAYSLVKAGGSVHLLHVAAPHHPANPLIGGQYEPMPLTTKAHKRKLKEAKAKLRQLVPAEAAARGVASETEVVVQHEPALAICQAAERLGADAICIASHGRSGLSAAVFGSVAQAVLARSQRPVYLVQAKPR